MFCMGIAASMGAVLLAAGEKGKRFILPHSKVMIHEPLLSGGISGPTSTIRKTAEDMIETKRIINGILAECTGKTIKQIDKATAFDNFMSAKEAIDFGLCDKIITSFELSQLTVKHKI
jgi:ATP-dependent Clp protease protease subunit